MKKNFYAVKKGLAPGIYETWEECRANVTGFPGATFKGFATRAEAEAFLQDEDKEALQPHGEDAAVAYVDGSYHVGTGEYSYGAVLFFQGQEQQFSEKFTDPELSTMRNVAGEIEGSKCAMKFCLERGIPKLELFYDYEGIEKWCTGVWKANKEGTIAYRDFYREASKKLTVSFHKVKGHSGDRYNELADHLAKKALGLEE